MNRGTAQGLWLTVGLSISAATWVTMLLAIRRRR